MPRFAESVPLSSFWVASVLPAKTKLPTRASHAGLCPPTPTPALCCPSNSLDAPCPSGCFPTPAPGLPPLALQTSAQEAVQGLLGKGLPQTLSFIPSRTRR